MGLQFGVDEGVEVVLAGILHRVGVGPVDGELGRWDRISHDFKLSGLMEQGHNPSSIIKATSSNF